MLCVNHHTESMSVLDPMLQLHFCFLSCFSYFSFHFHPLSHYRCSPPVTFPGILWAVAAMSKSFPCGHIGGLLFPVQGLGSPPARLCPTPLTLQWSFMLPRPPSLLYSTMLPSSGAQRSTGDTTSSNLHPFPWPVLSLTHASRVRYRNQSDLLMSRTKCLIRVLFTYSAQEHHKEKLGCHKEVCEKTLKTN